MQKTSMKKCETKTKQFAKLCPLHFVIDPRSAYYDEAKGKWRKWRKLREREAGFK